jgi:ParB family chromosome partitioning protein
MPKRKTDFDLPTLDDLFSTQEERDEAKLDKIRDIPLELIDDFPDHPFQVRDDEDMQQLVDSIKTRGVLTPAVLREKEDGRYELVSGHRRKRACELAGLSTLRSEIKDLSRDEAIIYMVESNFQRSSILPSEKAFSYKMRLEAIKRQAGRPKAENGVPVGHDSLVGKSREIIAAQSTDSNTQIQRYIRLTHLIPELLDLVDEGSIKMRPAVELSYLDYDYQKDVLEEIEVTQSTPSHAQTIRMRKMQDEGTLSTMAIREIMSEEKPNQKERIILRGEKVRKLIPKAVPIEQTEDYIYKAIEHYNKFLSKKRSERDSR